MGFYTDQVLPRVIDKMLGNEAMAKVRRPALDGLHGTVVEIGFGSGPNVPLYPDDVEQVLAIDPALVGRKLAAKRVARAAVPVRYVGLDGQRLPLEDGSADCVLSTWTLCSIPDVDAALREARRVLKPGGVLHFLEHGLAPDPKVARWQHRLTPIQRRVAGGCHLDRDIPAVVSDAGFAIERLANRTLPGPKSFGYLFIGVARPA